MIIVAIIALSGVVLAAIMVVFGNGLPALPSWVMTRITLLLGYFDQGKSFIGAFYQISVINTLVDLTLAATVLYEGYKLVMWIAKKIPMFGVSE